MVKRKKKKNCVFVWWPVSEDFIPTLQSRGTWRLHTPPEEPWNWQAHVRILWIPKCLPLSELFLKACAMLTLPTASYPSGSQPSRFTSHCGRVSLCYTDCPRAQHLRVLNLETPSSHSVHILFRATRPMSNRLNIRNRGDMSHLKSR